MMWILGRNLALSLAAAALLAGCGSRSPGGSAAQSPTKAAKKAVAPADQLSPNMVSAVAASKPSMVPVQVKFDLRDRPQIGQPLQIELAIVPISASVERVSGKVEGDDDGLELLEGADISPAEHPVEGVPIRHLIKLVPKREGVFTVRTVVTVDAGGSSSTESYAMPLIADSGAGPAKGGAATAVTTAAAQ
jgi:hypothetical protein